MLKVKDLPNQTMGDVFEEFYRLKRTIKENPETYEKNYAVMRLVTIIEQFFRCVVEIRLKDKPEYIPPKIEISPHIIDNISDRFSKNTNKEIKNHMISLTYSFQNTNYISKTMQSIKLRALAKSLESGKIYEEFDKLFQLRHNLTHTVDTKSVPHNIIMNYYTMTEELMRATLDELDVPEFSFYLVQGDAFYTLEYDDAVVKNCYCKALEKFIEKVKKDPVDFDTHIEMAWIYLRFRDLTNTKKHVNMVLKVKPDDAEANYCKGMFLRVSRRPATAVSYFQKSIESDPCRLDAYNRLATYFFHTGQIEKCMACLDYAIQNISDEITLYLFKGRMLSEQLNYPKWADTCFKQADECALKFVENHSNDANTCKSLLRTLEEYGRADTIKRCHKILNEAK